MHLATSSFLLLSICPLSELIRPSEVVDMKAAVNDSHAVAQEQINEKAVSVLQSQNCL